MSQTIFSLPNIGSARAWGVSSLVSLMLHGLMLGALGFATTVNFTKTPDASIDIDLDMVAAAPPAPVPEEAPAIPEQTEAEARQEETAPEEIPEPMPTPQKVEKPKPAPKKQAPKKPAVQKMIAAKEPVAGSSPAAAKAPAKVSSSPASAPVPLGGSSCPRPPYPDLARKRGQEGMVNVRCQVDSSGKVTAVSLAKSSGFKLLDEAALKTVGKWKFKPGSRDGGSVAGTVVVPVQFKLQ